MKCLLIGGSRDGEWIEVDVGRRSIALPRCKPIPVTPVNIHAPAEFSSWATEQYNQRVFCDEKGGMWYTYVLFGHSKTVFEALLHGYNRGRTWIASDEQLPEDGQRVVVYFEQHDSVWAGTYISIKQSFSHWCPLVLPGERDG